MHPSDKASFAKDPTYMVDETGKIIEEYDALTNHEVTGPGGNEKTGKYFYGTDYDALNVNIANDGKRCMEQIKLLI